MQGPSEKKPGEKLEYSQQYIKKLSPFKYLLYFLLGALSILFVALSMSLLYARVAGNMQGLQLPLIFHANTVIIISSSFSMFLAMRSLRQDEIVQYRWALGVTFGLGLAFIVFQFLGWQQMFANGISMANSPAGSYLYLISGIHALHILAGLVILGVFFVNALFLQKDPVKELLFMSDPAQPTKISILATYWHFVDILWLYLYGFFLIVL